MKTIKRIAAVLLATVLLFSGIPMAELNIGEAFVAKAAQLQDGHKTYGDYVYMIETDEQGNSIGVTIVYYTGSDTDVIIPEKIENLPVIKLYEGAFSPNGSDYYQSATSKLESVTMPDTVEEIGKSAFMCCKKLTDVKLSANLKVIAESAFEQCESLEKLELGNKLESVGKYFIAYTKITDLIFPGGAGVTLDIKPYALYYSNVRRVKVKSDFVIVNSYSMGVHNIKLEEVVFEGEVVEYKDTVFGGRTMGYVNGSFPRKLIFKNKFPESVYRWNCNSYECSYVDNWENTGWTVFFRTASDAEYLTDGEYKYFLNNDKAVIVGYESENVPEHIIVPQTLGGKQVAELGYGVFKGVQMKEVTIPLCIEHIGSSVFEGCTLLEKVNYNTDYRTFGNAVFKGCKSLKKIVLPDNVTLIPDEMFYSCTSLENVTAKGAVVIGEYAFRSCSSLANVKFSDDLHTVNRNAFYECANLKSLGVSGEKITSVSSYSFYRSGIESFIFSNKIKAIPYYCFSESAISEVTIPESIETIDSSAFRYCENLTEIKLPNSLNTIAGSAFAWCTALSELEIPASVQDIQGSAFYGCSSLNGNLILGNNLTHIGNSAFSKTNFTTLYYNIIDYKISDDDVVKAFKDVVFENIVIGEDVKTIPSGIFADQTKIKAIAIPDTVTTIEKQAFSNCTALINISIPYSVTKIGEQAFEGCTSLEGVEFSNDATELKIKSAAFSGCTAMEEFTVCKGVKELSRTAIPSSVTTVYFNAANCEFTSLKKNDNDEYISPFANGSITEIVIGDTVKRIPDYFMSAYGFVDELVIPESVTEIGVNAFKDSSITSVSFPSKLVSIEIGAFGNTAVQITGNTFPESLRMIGEKAFANCNTLTELDVPDTVVYIDEGAFVNCTNLAKMNMSSNVKYLMANTFYGCTALKDFVWESDVKLIGKETFAYCESLSEFDFIGVEKIYPNSFIFSGVKVVALGENKYEQATDLVSVEKQSFKNCADLETLSIGGNVATIKSEAFADCSNLEVAVISNSVINIASDAFDGCNSLTIYCMENSYAHDYAVQNNIPVSTFVIAPIPNQTYTGGRIEPELDVSVSNKHLTENTDFSVKYADNINVGTAKVTVSGKGIYKVLTSVASFTIITKNIAPVTIAPVADQNYTGEAVTPSLTVTDGSNILREGTDYTVTYKNNVNTGTATATIQGIGNYSGTASVTFTILEQSFFERLISAISTFFTTIITWLQALFSFII